MPYLPGATQIGIKRKRCVLQCKWRLCPKGGFFAILRTRFACAQPAIFSSADRSPQSAQAFGKTSISFAGAGAKTCGLNALAHNLYIARIAQGQNQVLGEFPIHIVFAHGAETKPSPCRRLSLCFCFTLRMARRMCIFGFDSA